MNIIMKDKLTIKDLIITGIFSAIYFALNFAAMISGGIAPVVWIAMPVILALVCGTVYMMLVAKVPKGGPVLIMAVITALLYVASGQLTMIILVSYLITAVAAELIRALFGYKSFAGNLLGYCAFSLGIAGSPLQLWILGDKFLNNISENGMPAEYVQKLTELISSSTLVIMIVGTVVAAVIGGYIGKTMLSKHLIKAGIV